MTKDAESSEQSSYNDIMFLYANGYGHLRINCSDCVDAITEAVSEEHKEKVSALGLLTELATAEHHYRFCHDNYGSDDIKTGRAWDVLRRAGDKARRFISGEVPSDT